MITKPSSSVLFLSHVVLSWSLASETANSTIILQMIGYVDKFGRENQRLFDKVWKKSFLQRPKEFVYNTLKALDQMSEIQMDDPVKIIQFCHNLMRNEVLIEIPLCILHQCGNTYRHQLKQTRLDLGEIEFALNAHDSLTVQELLNFLESCSSLDNFEDLCDHICIFLHQLFIDRPNCIRILHFQGYSLNMIPILVEKVPSLRIVI